jgi:hypothetical protein
MGLIVLYRSWNMARFVLRIWHVWFGKGSVSGIEDCIGSDGIYTMGYSELGVVGALNMGRYIIEYSDVLSLDIVPSESFTRYELPALLGTPLVDGHLEKKLANFQEAMYSL